MTTEVKKRIKVNKAQCAKCQDIIESKSVYDFKGCKCGAIYVDGGREDLRRFWTPDMFSKESPLIELSEYEE